MSCCPDKAPPAFDCMVCRGACCETVLLPPNMQVQFNREWAEVRGRLVAFTTGLPPQFRVGEERSLELPCPCPKLAPDGMCSIYETRPQFCRNYRSGSDACRDAIRRRRTPEQQARIFATRKP